MTRRRAKARWLPYVLLIVGSGLGPGMTRAAQGQEPKVTIEGGVRSDNPQFFDWTITSEYSSPLVTIEIPHTNADSLIPPGGWHYKWLKNEGSPRELGKTVCRATVEKPENGLAMGRPEKFSMRINREGAMPRPGKMRFTFADGKVLVVAGVELPSGQQTSERGIVTITLGVAFVIFLIVHARRRKRAQGREVTAE